MTTHVPPSVSYREAFAVWCRVAALSFGGPAGQIAVMHRILVEEKKWISEHRFLHALNYCMLLPGPEAQQLATYIGWLMHGVGGGLTAGLLFVLPGFVSILVLSLLYASFQQTMMVGALFLGLKPAVVAIVVEALIRIGKRVLRNRMMLGIAAGGFLALFFFEVPFPAVVFGAGLIGLNNRRGAIIAGIGVLLIEAWAVSTIAPVPWSAGISILLAAGFVLVIGPHLPPDIFQIVKGHGSPSKPSDENELDAAHMRMKPSWRRSAAVLLLGLSIWFGPLIVLMRWLGPEHVLVSEGVFFSKTAVVTFGGAYSVLSYVAQQAVERFQWLQAGEMLDGLGMAETTPGPLIQVVQFVGFLGAYRHAAPFDPIVAGVLGSAVTTWVTFVPCFLWIFLGAPYVEKLREKPALSGALSAITAAVVGVILNLAVWFALHILFAEVATHYAFGTRWLVPNISTLQPGATAIALLAFLMLFYFKRGMPVTLTVAGIAGLVLSVYKSLI